MDQPMLSDETLRKIADQCPRDDESIAELLTDLARELLTLRARVAALVAGVEKLNEARSIARPMGSTRHFQVAWIEVRAALAALRGDGDP